MWFSGGACRSSFARRAARGAGLLSAVLAAAGADDAASWDGVCAGTEVCARAAADHTANAAPHRGPVTRTSGRIAGIGLSCGSLLTINIIKSVAYITYIENTSLHLRQYVIQQAMR